MTSKSGFQPGQSGNPAGRPKGCRTKVAEAMAAILEQDAEDIARELVTLAKAGDPTAMRLVVDRLAPVRKGAPITFTLPPIATEADAVGAMGGVLAAVASGEITPEEGQAVASLVGSFLEAVKTNDHARDLAEIRSVLVEMGKLRHA